MISMNLIFQLNNITYIILQQFHHETLRVMNVIIQVSVTCLGLLGQTAILIKYWRQGAILLAA